MSIENQKFGKYNPPIQKWIIPLSILVSTFIFGGTFLLVSFCPNFILDPHPKYFNLAQYIYVKFMKDGIPRMLALGCLYWIINGFAALFNIVFNLDKIRLLICGVTFRSWLVEYIDEHTKIINSCDASTFNDRVAIIFTVCNDLTENTILQTLKQTYKNVEGWILDDSFKEDEINRNKQFIKDHPEIKYFKRDDLHRKNHPSQIGNIMAWVKAHGDNYDYIFENNTSSIATSTFVENSLCYFHSPLLSDKKVGGIATFGSFYYSNTVLSWINSMYRQFIFNNNSVSTVRTSGKDVYLHGWGCFYRLEAIKNIDWVKAECPVCDLGRGSEITSLGYDILLNPFDCTSKVGVRDMDGFRKQNLKWLGGQVHLLRNQVTWGRELKNQTFAIRHIGFLKSWSPIFFLLGCTMNIASAIFGVFAVINFPNFTSTLFIAVIWTIVVVPMVILGFKNRMTIRTILGWVLFSFILRAIYWIKLYYVVVKHLILKQWSCAAVTKKTNINYSFSNKLKLCWKDAVWILIVTLVCLLLQFVAKYPPYPIWRKFYLMFALPSFFFILFVFIGEIRIKKGWDPAQKEWPDFYKTFIDSYKVVKNSEIWQRQHPEKL